MKKITSILLVLSMLFGFVLIVGAQESSPVINYGDAEPGDLLYTLDFNGDSAFNPAGIDYSYQSSGVAWGANFDDNFEVSVSDDGTAMTVRGKYWGEDETINFWGGDIDGMPTNAHTNYTMIYKNKK